MTALSGPKWRNWQTRQIQGLVPARVSGFESPLRHHPQLVHISTVIHRPRNRRCDAIGQLGPAESNGLLRIREQGRETSAIELARAPGKGKPAHPMRSNEGLTAPLRGRHIRVPVQDLPLGEPGGGHGSAAMKRSPRGPRSASRKGGARPSTSPSPINKATREQSATFPARGGVAAPQPSRDAFPIVGIGASAGGLEAFSELLAHLSVDAAAMAFVLVQHLDPKYPSFLSEILSRTTRMPVVEVKNGMSVEIGHVYVMPPNTRMTIVAGVLNLTPRSDDPGPHMPIDHFLRSLAEDLKSRAIGVILSGSASDGALGLRAIKAEGGITFAEAPQSAKFDGMPRSAMASGAVDFVLPPKAIAQELIRIGGHPYLDETSAASPSEPLAGGPDALARIFRMLREKSGLDFTLYRQTTIRRRIARRMLIHGVGTLEAYRRYLEEHPSQVHALYNDLLVNVTRFFRDADAFRILQRSVFPSIIKQRPVDAPIRIWAPGCATGEEAYSLAIELIECLGDESGTVPIQLFGTDVSETSIAKARAGVYPENIELDVTAARLRRFFVKLDGQYHVRKSVRELCVV